MPKCAKTHLSVQQSRISNFYGEDPLFKGREGREEREGKGRKGGRGRIWKGGDGREGGRGGMRVVGRGGEGRGARHRLPP